MKKTALLLVISVGFLAQSGFGAVIFSFSPSGPTSVTPGTTFNETLQLQITNQSLQVVGFDTILEALNPQSGNSTDGFFAIAGANSDQAAWDTRSGVPSFPEILTGANSDHTGFVQNAHDVGFTGDIVDSSAFSSANAIATFTISVAPGTPNGIYVFQTTGPYTSSLGGATSRFSDIGTATGTLAVDEPATFSITVGAVPIPEPATWSLLGFGGIASLGLKLLRARRKD
jgi:hypothetical protein